MNTIQEQKRVKIAKALGAKFYYQIMPSGSKMLIVRWPNDGIGWSKGYAEKCHEASDQDLDGVCLHGYVPDYFNDLNAMHKAEDTLDYDQASGFDDELSDLVKLENDAAQLPRPWRFAVTHASAELRAESLGRALALWRAGQ